MNRCLSTSPTRIIFHVTCNKNIIDSTINFHRNTRGCSFSSKENGDEHVLKRQRYCAESQENTEQRVRICLKSGKAFFLTLFFGILTGGKERDEIACAVRRVATWVINTSQVNTRTLTF